MTIALQVSLFQMKYIAKAPCMQNYTRRFCFMFFSADEQNFSSAYTYPHKKIRKHLSMENNFTVRHKARSSVTIVSAFIRLVPCPTIRFSSQGLYSLEFPKFLIFHYFVPQVFFKKKIRLSGSFFYFVRMKNYIPFCGHKVFLTA